MKVSIVEQLPHHVDADGRAGLRQAVNDFRFGEVGPLDVLLHGVAGRVTAEDLLEVVSQLRHVIKTAFPSPFLTHPCRIEVGWIENLIDAFADSLAVAAENLTEIINPPMTEPFGFQPRGSATVLFVQSTLAGEGGDPNILPPAVLSVWRRLDANQCDAKIAPLAPIAQSAEQLTLNQ